jgi:tRNA nucleotidyltransferase (CCA-adding enzyme)
MDVVLCHRTADFDALGAAVGWARLHPGARIVLCGGTHPAVRDFLALYRNEYPLIERRSVSPDQLSTIAVVDNQHRALLSAAADWLDLPQVQIQLYDHHTQAECDILAHSRQVEAVGATTTLIAELLQAKNLSLSMAEATVMALGIHVDTGSLTYDHATMRDAAALTWLMGQGANQKAIATYTEPGFSSELQELLGEALPQLETVTVHGYRLAWVMLSSDRYVPGLSSLTSQLMVLSESDALVLGHWYQTRSSGQDRLTIIARSRIEGADLATLLQPLGGGGHAQAAAATLKTMEPGAVLTQLMEQLQAQIPPPPVAAELMSAPVRTILPETSIDQARRILLRYGHSGLSVMDEAGRLVGILSRRDLDIALHHGFGHAPVKGYMTAPVRTISPQTTLPEIESLMVTYDIGRLPVVSEGELVGIVTRTDILRQIHHLNHAAKRSSQALVRAVFQIRLDQMLAPNLRQILAQAAAAAQDRGWQLYLVGGAVRDLLLAGEDGAVSLREFDLVVDGVKSQQMQGAGVELARSLQGAFDGVQLQVYGQFQTASLLWQEGSEIGSFAVDIATARSEFYPYPAANPEVSASSIRQDLYRRDFTVNALAVRLTSQGLRRSETGELLDFFGGVEDLEQRQIRVLHPNSFIEDPTRIFRAVRFATRLGFALEPQTESYIHNAIASGIYTQIQSNRIQSNGDKAPALQSRLRNELKYIFQLSSWPQALDLMAKLGALQCIHRDLVLDRLGWRRIRLALRWLDCFDPESKQLPRWLIILESLLLSLPDPERIRAAAQLHLPELTQQRFLALAAARTQFESLVQMRSPSQAVQLLKRCDLPLLIEVAVESPVAIRRQIWLYLDRWAKVKPLLSGADLIELGYSPGPEFKAMLDEVIAATLDGVVRSKEEAIAWVLQQFPNR